MPPPTEAEYNKLKQQVEKLQEQVKTMGGKLKEQIKTVSKTRESTADLDLTGGLGKIFDEAAQIYNQYGESIKSTGKLMELLSGDEGFVNKFARMAESGVETFGGIKQMVGSLTDLNKQMTFFAGLQEKTQTHLGKTLAVFKDLGVEAADFTGVLDSSMIGFGMTAEKAEELTRAVAQVGTGIKGGMGEAMKNFKTAQSSMAYDTSRLLENFKQLQFTAATTGVEFSKLTSVFGEQFDSFEGASGKAGQLNAILGRSVFNSIDLLGKTEGERIQTIIQGIRETTNVQALQKNKFQLKAVADGLGLSPDETRRLLTGQMSVDQALAAKEPKDPREKTLKAMAEIVGSNVNPGLETFTAMLNSSRTGLEKFMISINAGARGFVQDLGSVLGFGENTTPTQLYVRMEEMVSNIADATKRQAILDQVKKRILEGEQDYVKFQGEGATSEQFKNLVGKLKDDILNITKGVVNVVTEPRGSVKESLSEKARLGEVRGISNEAQAEVRERVEVAISVKDNRKIEYDVKRVKVVDKK